MFSCNDLTNALFGIVLTMSMLTFIQVAMIVYGVRNPTITCVSSCSLQACDLPHNTPYILPTPPIGINVSQALIVGGNIGFLLVIAFTIWIRYKKDNFWTPLLLLPSIPFLAAVAWMIVSFIVYTQTIELCTAYKSGWSVDMTPLNWLLGANIVGMIVLIGPYVIPYVLLGLKAPCSDSTGLWQLFHFRDALCPWLNCISCKSASAPNEQALTDVV
jgi:hypothetical protein